MNQILSIFLFLNFLASFPMSQGQEDSKETSPNIVIILANDLGFNDVSFHGSNQFYTPNIDNLGYQGLILNNYYSPSVCSGSIASFFTGKYPSRLGLQAASLQNDESAGLGQMEKLMPQYFKEAGYRTHLVGKWHLGFHKKVLTPMERGFDHHFGPWGGRIDYFNHTHKILEGSEGLDMRNGTEMAEEGRGIHATKLFSQKAIEIVKEHNFEDQPLFLVLNHLAPGVNDRGDLQAPSTTTERFRHIRDVHRRLFVSMTHEVDEEIGQLIDTLASRQILNNTVIVFISTNGGMVEGHMRNFASNYPLRGQKMGPFEGGVRAVATLWSPKIQSRHRVSRQLMHTADWLPTLAAMANIDTMPRDLDGMNLWPALSSNMPSPRSEILHTINPIAKSIVFLTADGWKLVNAPQAKNHARWTGILPKDEKQNTSYYNSIITSKTWPALNEFAEFLLNEAKITSLRTDATVTCGKNTTELNEEECTPCLFHIPTDPCETQNLASIYPEILAQIRNQVDQQHPTMFPVNVPGNTRSDPRYFNNTWTFWSDVIVAGEKFTEL